MPRSIALRPGARVELSLVGDGAASAAGVPQRTIGLPLSSATGSTAPWEAATAIVEVLARRPEVGASLLATDPGVLDVLGDHPVLDDPRVTTRAAADDQRVARRAWLRGIELLLLPYRRPTRSDWPAWCDELGVRVVSAAGAAGRGRAATVGQYEVGPSGAVDADEIAVAVLAALDDAGPSARAREQVRTVGRITWRDVRGRT